MAANVAARSPSTISPIPRLVASSIAANASAFDCPALKKKSLGGRAGGRYPNIRVAPSTPTASSHPVVSPSMIASWLLRIFFPTSLSGFGSREMMLPSRSAIRIEAVAVGEFLGEVDHFFAGRVIDPVIADGKPILGHGAPKERLRGNRRVAQRI